MNRTPAFRLRVSVYGYRLNRSKLFKQLSKFLDIKKSAYGDTSYSILRFGKDKMRTAGLSFELANEVSFEESKLLVSKIKKIKNVTHVEVHAVVYYDSWTHFFETNKIEPNHEAMMDKAIRIAKDNETARKALEENPNAQFYRVSIAHKEDKIVVTDGPVNLENGGKNIIAEVELE